jgi:hypothetical protein
MSKNHTSELDYDLLISQAIDWILDKDTEHDVDLLEHIKTLQKVLLSEEAKAGTKKAGLLEWLADLLEIYEGFAVSQLKHKIGDVVCGNKILLTRTHGFVMLTVTPCLDQRSSATTQTFARAQ